MTASATWHADSELLADYVSGRLGRASEASIEAHLVNCASCRAAIVPLVPSERLDRNLTALEDLIDQPPLQPIERVLQKLGVPDRITRVLAITPSTLAPWLIAVAMAVALAFFADLADADNRTLFLYLVIAPLLPMAAVAMAFTARGDPARELIVAAPTPGFDLLLVRALAVLVPAVTLLLVASLLIPQQGLESVLWLLPSLGLAAAALALGTWFPVRTAACVLGGLWVTAALISVRGAPRTEMVDQFAAFRPAGQVALVALALLAGAVAALRRDRFDTVEIGGIS